MKTLIIILSVSVRFVCIHDSISVNNDTKKIYVICVKFPFVHLSVQRWHSFLFVLRIRLHEDADDYNKPFFSKKVDFESTMCEILLIFYADVCLEKLYCNERAIFRIWLRARLERYQWSIIHLMYTAKTLIWKSTCEEQALFVLINNQATQVSINIDFFQRPITNAKVEVIDTWSESFIKDRTNLGSVLERISRNSVPADQTLGAIQVHVDQGVCILTAFFVPCM